MSGLVFPHTFVPWFRSVAPHIHAYRGKTFVIGITGELIAAGRLNAFVQDISILHAMGVHLVLVHGFRPQVNEQLLAKGHASVFSHGMRVTDPVALDCAQEAAGQLRFEIEASIFYRNLGYRAPILDEAGYVRHIGNDRHVKHPDDAANDLSGVRRNAPCPCGSGLKLKHCHGALS